MKKRMSVKFLFAFVALLVVMAVTVSAAPSISIGNAEYVIDKENDEVTFTVPYTSQDVEQITLLATIGTKDGSLEETDENILYVDQQEATVGEFTFKVDYSKFTLEKSYIYIKIGGTAIDTADPHEGIKVFEDVVAICIYGDVTGEGEIDIDDVVMLVKYVGANIAGSQLNETEFPGGTFPGGAQSGEVTGEGDIDIEDIVTLVKYVGIKISGASFDANGFPGGKFPVELN